MYNASPSGRVTVAFVAAAMASAAVAAILIGVGTALWYPMDLGLTFPALAFVAGFFLALLHVVVLAVPLYLALTLRRPPTLGTALAASLGIAVAPLGTMDVVSQWDDPEWMSILVTLAFLAFSGAGGGLVFWVLMRGEADRCP